MGRLTRRDYNFQAPVILLTHTEKQSKSVRGGAKMKVSVKANHTSIASFSVVKFTFVNARGLIFTKDLLNSNSVDSASWDEHTRVGQRCFAYIGFEEIA